MLLFHICSEWARYVSDPCVDAGAIQNAVSRPPWTAPIDWSFFALS
jgi:hypothetical protein